MKFFVGFCCFLYVLCSGLWITELFRVFIVMGIFRRQWFTNSVQKIFLMFFFPYRFRWSSMFMFDILLSTVFTFLDLTIETSELLLLHIDSPSLVSWVTSKSHVLPTILQVLFWWISLLRSFLTISFLVEIFDLRNSVSLSRLVINFLSTTVCYSSWLCILNFCFTSFCIKSFISFFISGR